MDTKKEVEEFVKKNLGREIITDDDKRRIIVGIINIGGRSRVAYIIKGKYDDYKKELLNRYICINLINENGYPHYIYHIAIDYIRFI